MPRFAPSIKEILQVQNYKKKKKKTEFKLIHQMLKHFLNL